MQRFGKQRNQFLVILLAMVAIFPVIRFHIVKMDGLVVGRSTDLQQGSGFQVGDGQSHDGGFIELLDTQTGGHRQ